MFGGAVGASSCQPNESRMIEVPAERACWNAIWRSPGSASWKSASSVKPSLRPWTRAAAPDGSASAAAAKAAEASATSLGWAALLKLRCSNTTWGRSERRASAGARHGRPEGRQRGLRRAVAVEETRVQAPEVLEQRRVRGAVAPVEVDEPVQAQRVAQRDELRDRAADLPRLAARAHPEGAARAAVGPAELGHPDARAARAPVREQRAEAPQ